MLPALASHRPHSLSSPTYSPTQITPSLFSHPLTQLNRILQPLSFYTQHPAFLPSLSLSLLYFTVLSFSSQMITYLLSVRDSRPIDAPPTFSTTTIGLLRTLAAISEILATWLAPAIMRRIGPTRTGLWAINWQAACAAAGISLFWFLSPSSVAAMGLVVGVILSRIGLWGFDLSVQILIQEVGPPFPPPCCFFPSTLLLNLLTELLGRPTHPPRHLLVPRILPPESLRTPRLRHHHPFPSPQSIQIPSSAKRRRGTAVVDALCGVCEMEEGAFGAF